MASGGKPLCQAVLMTWQLAPFNAVRQESKEEALCHCPLILDVTSLHIAPRSIYDKSVSKSGSHLGGGD